MSNRNSINTLIIGLITFATGVSQSAHAALTIPDSPLFLGSQPQPNIMFALDDSGSMDFATSVEGTFNGAFILAPDNPPASSGSSSINGINLLGLQYIYTHPVLSDQIFNVSSGVPGIPPSEEAFNIICTNPGVFGVATSAAACIAQDEVVRLWNSDYNNIYYNPELTYTPWAGEDNAGNAFTNATPSAARLYPYDPGIGTFDLTTNFSYSTRWNNVTYGLGSSLFYPAFYYAWTDTTGDAIVDPNGTDSFTKVEIKSSVATYTNDGGATDRSNRSDCAAAPTCTYAEEIQNFANWFSYYRKREYVLKKAVSDLIDESTSRMGLATINNNTGGGAVSDMTVASNKEDLLDDLNQFNSSGGTPLRTTLRDIGIYFDDTDGASAPSSLGIGSASSPILTAADGGECQQNFAILMSDGFWNGSSPSVGNEDADGTGNDTVWDGGPHADSVSDTLADVAMKYYETDLSSLDDLVPEVENTDTNSAQHMVTYTVAFGLTGTGLTTPADHESTTPAPPWTTPSADAIETLDDMQHAAFNSRGLFLSAQNTQELIDSLDNAFADIETRTSFSATAVAINSTVLRTSARLFTALFNSLDWSGELRSFTLNSDGTLDTEQWEAGAVLDATTQTFRLDPTNGRMMFTIVDKSGTPTPISFDNTDADLVTAVGSTTIIDYIRGDQSGEIQNGGTLRNRSTILADIIKSSPVSSGAENFFYDVLEDTATGGADHGGGATYLSYLSAKDSLYNDASGAFSLVYVGTNGGTLHAIDSRDGSEVFAYVPKTVHGNLNLLTDPNYGHKFFVNASGFAADAYIDLGSGNAWKTLYISGLGEGGRGIFALDITDPLTSPSTSNVLWEKNSADTGFSELGYITFRPRLAFLNNDEWGIILGNGYNSDLERAQLFILNPVDGSIIKVIDTEEDGSSNSNLPTNGLGEPFLLDEDGNRTVDFVYAADLQGNIWKFDLSASNSNSWSVEFSSGGNPAPLYQALDGKGSPEPQPITTRPVLATHPDGGFMVMFGTGKYIEPSDNTIPASPDIHTFYGIRDDGDEVADGRGDLVEQTIVEEVDILDGNGDFANRARIVSENTVDYSSKDGWFIDLLTPGTPPTAEGEMIIADPLTRFGRAIFTTFIPGDTPCDQGGQSVIMELDAVSGARLQNSVFDFNNDGVIDADDLQSYGGSSVPGSGIFIPATLASPAVISAEDASAEYKQSSGLNTEVTTTMESTGGLTVGRQSWRQLR